MDREISANRMYIDYDLGLNHITTEIHQEHNATLQVPETAVQSEVQTSSPGPFALLPPGQPSKQRTGRPGGRHGRDLNV